jgi:L-malate glycosyltransferase
MKICFFAPANSIHSYRWVKFFIDRGHDVYWLSLYKSLLDEQGISLNSFPNLHYYEMNPFFTVPLTPFAPPPKNIFRILSAVKWVRKLLKEIKPELMHVHSVGVYGLVAAMSFFHPTVATAWGSDVLMGRKSKVKRLLVKYVLGKVDLITCDAKHMVEAMVKLGGDKNKIRIIYFGIDTDRFRPAEKDEELTAQLGITGYQSVISLRNFYPVYDIESLIRAMPLVLKAVPDAKFVIVGSGPEEENIKKLALSLGVMENVRFTGKIPNSDLIKYLSSMDVYVSTSLSDAGIAASTAEAMSCGLPVVITDSGENGEWVKNGEGGFLVPVKNPEALAEKIVFLLKDASLRKAAGSVNRKIIMEKNDYYKEMLRMEKIYGEIIQKTERTDYANDKIF